MILESFLGKLGKICYISIQGEKICLGKFVGFSAVKINKLFIEDIREEALNFVEIIRTKGEKGEICYINFDKLANIYLED